MVLPPAIIIHGLPQACLALAPGRPVTLLSGPGAASYAGCAWWRALVAAALAGRTGVPDILDCGNAPGRVLEALSLGCRLLALQPGPAWDGLAARARSQGGTLLQAPPPALDLAQPGAVRQLPAWLGIP